MNKFLQSFIVTCLALTSFSIHAENLDKCLRAWDYTEIGHYAEAISLYNECIEEGDLSNAHLARTYRNIGITYHRTHQFKEAILAYNQAIALKPKDIYADYVNRGNIYDEDNQFELALADYDAALSLNPEDGEIHYNKGITYEHNQMLKEAKEEFISAYQHGLRTSLLYNRFVVYGLFPKGLN